MIGSGGWLVAGDPDRSDTDAGAPDIVVLLALVRTVSTSIKFNSRDAELISLLLLAFSEITPLI